MGLFIGNEALELLGETGLHRPIGRDGGETLGHGLYGLIAADAPTAVGQQNSPPVGIEGKLSPQEGRHAEMTAHVGGNGNREGAIAHGLGEGDFVGDVFAHMDTGQEKEGQQDEVLSTLRSRLGDRRQDLLMERLGGEFEHSGGNPGRCIMVAGPCGLHLLREGLQGRLRPRIAAAVSNE